MKAVVAAFNQEKALVGAFSVITNLRMELFGALICTHLELVRQHLQHGLLVHGLLVGPEVVKPLDHSLLQVLPNTPEAHVLQKNNYSSTNATYSRHPIHLFIYSF